MWERLISVLDYHHGKWYGFVGGQWRKVTEQSLRDELKRTGHDVSKIVKQFRYRDNQTTARNYPKE
jgi:hypothetical protein